MVISKEACFYLGYISKVKGFKGELVFFLDVDDPFVYKNLERVLIEINGSLTPFYLEDIHVRENSYAEVLLEGIETREEATDLSGKELYLPLTDLPNLPDDQYYLHDLEGMRVEDDKHGDLGVVNKVFDYSNNPILQVFKGTDEVLIPLNDHFVKSVDKKEKVIRVDLPEGLVEINKA